MSQLPDPPQPVEQPTTTICVVSLETGRILSIPGQQWPPPPRPQAAPIPKPNGEPVMSSIHYADIMKALLAIQQLAQVVQVIAPKASGAAKLEAAVGLAAVVAPTLKDTMGGLQPLREAISAVVTIAKAPGGAMERPATAAVEAQAPPPLPTVPGA